MSQRVQTTILLGVLGLGGCAKLPDQVPYRAMIMAEDNALLALLIGGELLLEGEVLGTIVASPDGGHVINVDWTGPKTEIDAVIAGNYAVRLAGACGELTLSAEGPPQVWREGSEHDRAKILESDGKFPVYIDAQLPKRYDLLVDWGSGTHEVRVGERSLAQGEKQLPVFLEGCESGPKVMVDGKDVGALDPSAPVHLISADATRCHQIIEISFGDHSEALAAPIVTRSQVTPLEMLPYYLFERAPDVLTVPQGVEGTKVEELTAFDCSPAAEAPPL